MGENRIGDALDVVYRAFAAPPPPVIDGCPCCIEKRGVDVLLTTPLRQLSGDALFSYVSGVYLTVGSDRDFKYLLPRILDVAIHDSANSIDVEIVLGKLALAEWLAWPAVQRQAVENLIKPWFELVLAQDLTEIADGWIGWETERLLCGIARAGLPLKPWLARLQEPDAAPILADMKKRFPDDLSGFWEDAPAGLGELAAATGRNH